MCNATADVLLSNGEAMFVGSEDFGKHIANMETMPKAKKVILVLILSLLNLQVPSIPVLLLN